MLKRKFFLISAILAILILFFIFVRGIARTVEISVNDCSATYKEFVIYPYAKNIFCTTQPCFRDGEKFDKYNAQAEIFMCLCNDKDKNDIVIREFYTNNRNYYTTTSTKYHSFGEEVKNKNINELCKWGEEKRYAL